MERRRRKVLHEIVRIRQEKSISNDDTVNLAVVLNSFKERYEIHPVEVTERQSSRDDGRSTCVGPGIMTTFYKIDWKTAIDITAEEEQTAIVRLKNSGP